jgi:hypothetical protein
MQEVPEHRQLRLRAEAAEKERDELLERVGQWIKPHEDRAEAAEADAKAGWHKAREYGYPDSSQLPMNTVPRTRLEAAEAKLEAVREWCSKQIEYAEQVDVKPTLVFQLLDLLAQEEEER